MRPVWLGELTVTEGWPRLAGSLTVSVAVHCIVLGFTGLTAFSLLSPQEGSRSLRLTVDLPPKQLQAEAENTPRPVSASAVSGSVARHSESQQPGSESGQVHTPPPPVAAVVPSGLFPGPWYYAARYLHRRPTPLKPIRPIYPPEAENLPGQVILLLLINENGAVDTYRIIESQPPGIFDTAVTDAFVRERYAPGLITGYPVKSQLLVEVVFEPGSTPTTNVLPGLHQ
jgi:protein TonB